MEKGGNLLTLGTSERQSLFVLSGVWSGWEIDRERVLERDLESEREGEREREKEIDFKRVLERES